MENLAHRSDGLVLVTGTSAGIGEAIASALLATNWQVVGLSRRPAFFDGPGYLHYEIDLSDLAAVEEFAVRVLRPLVQATGWQRLGLVNNAAVLGSLRPLAAATPPQLAQVFAVNTVAPTYLMGFMARVVDQSVPLRIVNISSGAATQGIAGLGDYCGSKAALRLAGMALAAEFAKESGRDAAVLSYEPGVVETQMQEAARATRPEDFPSHQVFQDFAARGDLQPPAAVVDEVVSFLAAEAQASFTEKRFGAT